MLYKHQQELIDRNPARWLISHDPGTGKTRLCIELAIKNTSMTLVICPKSVKEKWKREIIEYDSLNKVKWLVLTKEEFRKDWDKLSVLFDGVIVDECHRFANYTSQMSKNLLKFINKVQPKYRWLASATCIPHEPLNIWTLARYLGHNWPFMEFRGKYYRLQYFGPRMVWVPRDDIKEEMAFLIEKIGNTVRIDECADIPEQTYEIEYLPLTKEQEKAIKKIEETETAAIVKWTHVHQIEQGCLKGDEYVPDQEVKNLKNERILELCESSERVAVFCRYKLQVEILEKYLNENLEDKKPIYLINGDTLNRDELTQQIDKAKKCVVLITSDTCEGYELPSVGLIIFASMSFSFVAYRQGCGRFLRMNRLKKNVYIHLITEGDSIDQGVYNAIQRGVTFDAAIYKRGRMF